MGIAALGLLKKEKLPSGMEIIEGGTPGYQLINFLEGKDKVILIDAIDAGELAGTIFCKKVVSRGYPTAAFNRYINAAIHSSNNLSLHQTDIITVLQLANKIRKMPQDLTVYGIQVEKVDFSSHLSPPVKKSLKKLIQLILKGIKC